MIPDDLNVIYKLLFERFGPQHWWPGESRLEIIVGAILTQNTNWSNVEKAVSNLKSADVLSVDKLFLIDISALAELIRPAGYYNVKAARLKNFLSWLFDGYAGRLSALDGIDTGRLRTELLSIKGIGRETADSILLYGLDRPVFVADAYTARIACRHALIEADDCDYEHLRGLFEARLPPDMPCLTSTTPFWSDSARSIAAPGPAVQVVRWSICRTHSNRINSVSMTAGIPLNCFYFFQPVCFSVVS